MIPRNLLDSITPDQCRAYLASHEGWTPGDEWPLGSTTTIVVPWLHTDGHEVLIPSVATADWLSRCAEVITACAAVEGRCECEVTKDIARGGKDPLPSAEAWEQAVLRGLTEALGAGAARPALELVRLLAAAIDEEAAR